MAALRSYLEALSPSEHAELSTATDAIAAFANDLLRSNTSPVSSVDGQRAGARVPG